jgi:cytochrome oxidase assembly protein ShyY1
MLSRRWFLFAVAVVVLAYGCWWLGEWQFGRLHDRETRNAQTTQNLEATPVPVDQVLKVGRGPAGRDEWRRVTATGRYLQDESMVVRYQTRDGASGVDVVTPLQTRSGAAVLVDRGWMSTGNTSARPQLPDAPAGQVTVVGWVRVDSPEGDSTTVSDRSMRAISSRAIAPTVSVPVYGGFVDAEKETPPAAKPLQPAEQPDLGNGPHFFYGVQWWFFGMLAVFGFFYLAWDERRKKAAQSERSMPPSTGNITPETNEAAGESRNAAAAPNSSGRP